MHYRNFLFDLDGTLVDSLADIAAGVNAARSELGLKELPLQAVRGFVGDGMTKLIERAIPEAALRKHATDIFREHYGVHLADVTRPYPGIPELLVELKASEARIAVVTNKPFGFAVSILDKLDLARHCGVVLGGDSTKEKKPSPEPFRIALERLGVAAGGAGETLVVGDGRNDILGAKAAGLSSCAVLWGFGDAAELRALAPEHAVESVQKLMQIL